MMNLSVHCFVLTVIVSPDENSVFFSCQVLQKADGASKCNKSTSVLPLSSCSPRIHVHSFSTSRQHTWWRGMFSYVSSIIISILNEFLLQGKRPQVHFSGVSVNHRLSCRVMPLVMLAAESLQLS